MASNRRPYTLHWSSLSLYETCPQKFLWSKGWSTVDLGYGLGKRKPLPVRKSEHHAILGTSIQYAIEVFYNSELWRVLDPETLKKRLLELADEAFRVEISKKYVDWREVGDRMDGREGLEKLIRDAVMGYMRTLKHHRLLGPYAKAEVELLAYVNKYTPVGGRADVIIRREDTGVTILDGKNSKRYKDPKTGKYTLTYTDPDQLRWYALLFYLIYKQMPDRLGFVYYRYPYGMPIVSENVMEADGVEEGIDWVKFTKDDLKGLAVRAVDTLKGMDRKAFDPKATPQNCKFCDYESICPERKAQKEANRRVPKDTTLDLSIMKKDGGSTFTMD